jgi:nicotinate-nucleotide pyrophosphorylase (carboxylating)
MLNLLGRACGVASLARRFVDAVDGTCAVICDTRKTIPGLRSLDKYAVRCGGGVLHRCGLHDAALYKDNHLAGVAAPDLASVITAAARAARDEGPLRFVEVEVDSLRQLEAVLTVDAGVVDIVLLDNMSLEQLRAAVAMRDERRDEMLLEASGGITLARVRDVAETGVDRISAGALTHAAPALDVGLDLRP